MLSMIASDVSELKGEYCSRSHLGRVRADSCGARAYSETSPCALFLRQHFETRGPPAGEDRLDELAGQPLGVHIRRERLVVVLDGNEFHVHGVADREQHVPHPGRAVVFRTTERSDVDDV